jgi:Flp pilus assembly protein TadG
MVLCLLLLCAGVIAATSVFLAHQRLQNACDGAAAAAADAVAVGFSADGGVARSAAQAADGYLRVRSPEVSATADASEGTVRLTCRAAAVVTFGALFGSPTLTQTVQSMGLPVL